MSASKGPKQGQTADPTRLDGVSDGPTVVREMRVARARVQILEAWFTGLAMLAAVLPRLLTADPSPDPNEPGVLGSILASSVGCLLVMWLPIRIVYQHVDDPEPPPNDLRFIGLTSGPRWALVALSAVTTAAVSFVLDPAGIAAVVGALVAYSAWLVGPWLRIKRTERDGSVELLIKSGPQKPWRAARPVYARPPG